MRHVISILVDNEAGVLSRVAGLFSGRGYNIESLTVAPTLEPTKSKMVITAIGDDQIIEQIKKQLNKLINIIKVIDHSELDTVEREMLLVKVKAEEAERAEVLRIADIFRAKVVDVSHNSYILELTGSKDKIQGFIDILSPIGILDFIRTGPVVMGREMKRSRK